MSKKVTKAARFKEGVLQDGTKFKSWLTVCPFPSCSANVRIAEETNKAGFFIRTTDERCQHVRFVHDDGTIEFNK